VTVASDDFKRALSRWASGVSVVTAEVQGAVYGLTVSSFSSVSLDPPLVSVCLANDNRCVSMIEAGGGFAVSILGAQHQGVSNAFAGRGREPTTTLDTIGLSRTPSGHAVVPEALGWLGCSVHELVRAGDHTIVIGRVLATGTAPSERPAPLLYFDRAYCSVFAAS